MLLVEADGPLGLAQGGVGEAQVAEGVPLAPPVADLARDDQLLLVEADGPLGLAQGGVGEAQVAEGVPLAPPVADLAHDDQLLLVEADGPLGLAQGGVGEAQVAEGVPLAPAVADLAHDDQLLLVEADGPLGLAQVGVGEAQRSQELSDQLRPHGLGDRLGQERLQQTQTLSDSAAILQPLRGRSQQLERPVVLARLEQMMARLDVGLNVG